jgi:hypothetical protein
VFESADAENLRCKSCMADARRSWHVAKCWRISCLSFVTAQRARGFESVPRRARKAGVIALLLKSGIALSHHDVSKKDLDLGLSVH